MTESILHIPAKTDTVRTPGKNWADIDGKPSIAWVIEAALASATFSRIIVSTNGPEIRNIALEYPVEIADQTPSTVIQTTHDVLTEVGDDARITIMLPTVALILPEDIQGAVKLSDESGDPVMVVTRLPYRIDEVVLLKDDGYLKRPFSSGPSWMYEGDPTYYADAGALYTFPPGQFKDVTGHYVSCLRPYIIPRYRGVDVDKPEDLEMVRRLFVSNGIEVNEHVKLS